MASFTGTKIKDTYQSILKVYDNGALDGTVQVITDGLGNSSALWLGTGAATITGDMSVWENFSVDTDTLVVDSIQDRVGINVGSPTEALDVGGNVKASGTLRIEGNATFDTNISVGGIIRNVNDLDTSISFGTNQISLITGGLTRLSASDASVQVTNALVASSTLTVTGNYSSTSGDISLANGKIVVGGSVSIDNSVGAASFSPNANLLVLGDTGAAANQGMTIVSPTGSTGNIYFADGTTGSQLYRGYVTYNHNSEKMFLGVNATDLVEIDSTSANVTGNLTATGSITGGTFNATSLNVSGNATFDTNTLFVDAANNRVGVGVSPSYKLHINTDSVAGKQNLDAINRTAQNFIRITNPNFSTDSSMGILLRVFPDSDSRQGAGIIASGGGSNNQTDLSLFVTNSSDVSYSAYRIESDVHKFYKSPSSEAMRIHSSGDISFRDSSANEAFYWDASAASLGIGTTGPSSRGLQIYKASADSGLVITRTGTGAAEFQQFIDGDGNIRFNNAANTDSVFYTNNTERMRIDSSGNVSISSGDLFITGDNILDVTQGNNASYFRRNASQYIAISSDSTYHQFAFTGSKDVYFNNTTANSMMFATNNTERMRITSEGYLGISTSSTDVLSGDLLGSLSFVSRDVSTYSSGGVTGIRSYATSSYNTGSVSGDLRFYTSDSLQNTTGTYLFGTERMRITSGGDVLIGTTGTPNGTSVYGSGFIYNGTSLKSELKMASNSTSAQNLLVFYNPNGAVGSITTSGSATSYSTSSDYRLKEDWVAMEGALDRVDALKPINFAWKADGKRVDGFLAHELAEVIPEAVTGEKDATEIRSVEVSPAVYEDVIHPAEEAILDEEGNVIQEAKEEWVEKVLVSEAVFEDQEFPVYQGIDQSKIVPLLAAGLQEAHALIKELRAELNALKQA